MNCQYKTDFIIDMFYLYIAKLLLDSNTQAFEIQGKDNFVLTGEICIKISHIDFDQRPLKVQKVK